MSWRWRWIGRCRALRPARDWAASGYRWRRSESGTGDAILSSCSPRNVVALPSWRRWPRLTSPAMGHGHHRRSRSHWTGRFLAAEAARRLGRSFRAIKHIRDLQRQKASGWIPRRESRAEPIRQRLWTEDEITVLTDESRTPTEIAAELGRSINSVTVSRVRWLGRLQGRVPDHLHGTYTGVSRYGCLCPRCRDVAEVERERRQGATRHKAVNYKEPWTDRDIEIALDRNPTVIEAAQR